MRVKRVALEAGENPGTGLRFWCPGCDESHVVSLRPGGWKWNGDAEAPTIEPSVKCENEQITAEGMAMIERGEPANIPIEIGGVMRMKYPTKPYCCHSVITAGLIRFCGDCTHPLVNRTVLLPDLDLAEEKNKA